MRAAPMSVALHAWIALGLLGCMVSPANAADCAALKPQLSKSNPLQAPPIAEELALPRALGTGFGLASSSAPTVEVVLSRAQHHECRASAAAAANAAKPPQGGSYRFNMTQGGKRMTADEFDAWMKAQGVRVVKSPARAEAPAPASQPAQSATPPKKKKR
jgi:hypothetical protein